MTKLEMCQFMEKQNLNGLRDRHLIMAITVK